VSWTVIAGRDQLGQAGAKRRTEPGRDDQLLEQAPDRLRLAIAEGLLGGGVELGDHAAGIDLDHGVERHVDQAVVSLHDLRTVNRCAPAPG
jgi:hypothetical protein